jgi:hypothetical protein
MDIESISVVAQIQEDIPQGKAIFAARDGHQDLVLRTEHLVFLDGSLDLLWEPLQVALLAEGQSVVAHVDNGHLAAFFALHRNTSKDPRGFRSL